MEEYKKLLQIGHVFQWLGSDKIFVITDINNDIISSYDKELGIDEECTTKDFYDSITDGSLKCIFPNHFHINDDINYSILEINENDVFIFSHVPELPCIINKIHNNEIHFTKGDALIRYYGTLENFIEDCKNKKIKIIYKAK